MNRLKDAGDTASWEEFHGSYRGLLVGVARRAGLNEHEAEEAVQETFIAVANKMPGFRYEPGKDSFKGWLLQIVRWKVADQARRRRRGAESVVASEPADIAEKLALAEDPRTRASIDLANLIDPTQDFAAVWEAEWERHLVDQALTIVKRQARPEHYAIYHLHVVEDRPVAEVRRTLGVSSAAVYLAKHRVGALVRRETLRLRERHL